MSLWTGSLVGVSLLMLSTLSCFFLGSIQSISPCLGWSLRKYPSYGLMNHKVLLLETSTMRLKQVVVWLRGQGVALRVICRAVPYGAGREPLEATSPCSC